MQRRTAAVLRSVAVDITADLAYLRRLADDIAFVVAQMAAYPEHARLFFELDRERIERLVRHYPAVWSQVEADCQRFIAWLTTIADHLDEGEDPLPDR